MRFFRKSGRKVYILKDGIDGLADSIRLLLNSRNYQLGGTFDGSALNDSNVKYYDVGLHCRPTLSC